MIYRDTNMVRNLPFRLNSFVRIGVLLLLFVIFAFSVRYCQTNTPSQLTVVSKCFGKHREWAYIVSPHIVISIVDEDDQFLPENGTIKGQVAYVFAVLQSQRIKIYIVKGELKINKNTPEWILDIGNRTQLFIDTTFGGINNILKVVDLVDVFDCTRLPKQDVAEGTEI